MSTIKCPNCNLINFATVQFCKRCNFSLKEASSVQNDTNISFRAGGMSIRQVPQKHQREPQPLPLPVVGYESQRHYLQQHNGQFYQNNYAPLPPQAYNSDNFLNRLPF